MLSSFQKRQKRKKIRRLIVLLFILVILLIIFLSFYKPYKNTKPVLSPLSRPPILTPTPTLQPITLQNSEGLQETISDALTGTHGLYGIAVKNLKTQEGYYSHQTRIFKAGSLYKLWVMATVYKQIKEGELKEDDTILENVGELNKVFHLDPNLAEKKDGIITLSVKDALYQMITISDNYAGLLLAHKIGLSNISNFLKQNGFNYSKVGLGGKDPLTTPLDISLFFEKLYKGQLIDKNYSDKMLTLLTWQKLNNKIPKYLPDNLTIAHKTGELDEVTHDGGIVYSDIGDYILVVLSESDSRDQAEERIADISKNVYNYFLSHSPISQSSDK